MKASPLEFRFRYLIHAIIYAIGFTAPWNRALHLDSIRTWQFLAAWSARTGSFSFSTATLGVLVLGILCAFLAASLRTWASAYLGVFVVQAEAMNGDRIVAGGPFRYLRNPLYLGTFVHTFALVLLMLPSGAIFCILFIGIFQLRLIAAEEPFLTAKLGEPYLAYCVCVPRIIPSPTPRLPASSLAPRWPSAFAGELYFWGTFVSFATLGWRYNSVLIIQGVVVSVGLSMVVHAFLPKQ